MSSDSSVAKRYADALFELGEEHDQLQIFEEELTSFVDAFEASEQLQHTLLNPGIELEERHRVTRQIAKHWDLSEMTRNFLLLLLDNDRVDALPRIVETFRERLDESRDRLRAEVTSAVPLDQGQKRAIESVLGDRTGKEIVLTTDVDESLIGGAVTRIGSLVYDGSIRSELERLKDNILQETA
jgi:F-type H+-transporting ATPase subunit delta